MLAKSVWLFLRLLDTNQPTIKQTPKAKQSIYIKDNCLNGTVVNQACSSFKWRFTNNFVHIPFNTVLFSLFFIVVILAEN